MKYLFISVVLLSALARAQQCPAPNYCADNISMGVLPYQGVANQPPALNKSFSDPVFHRNIWRLTDTTTDPHGLQQSCGVAYGQSNGNFDADMMMMRLSCNGDILFKSDFTNPLAPSVLRVNCSPTGWGSTGDMCRPETPSRGIHASEGMSNFSFANQTAHVGYGFNANTPVGSIVKRDWTATVASIVGNIASVPPTDTVMFNPFGTGNCMDGMTSGALQPLYISEHDTYFWGGGADSGQRINYVPGPGQEVVGFYSLIHYDSNTSTWKCKYIDPTVVPWQVRGDTWTGTFNGAVQTLNADGTAGTDMPRCSLHGMSFDDTSLTMNLSTSACADSSWNQIANSRNYWLIDLSTNPPTMRENPAGGAHDSGPMHSPTQGTMVFQACWGVCQFGGGQSEEWTDVVVPYNATNTNVILKGPYSMVDPDFTAGGLDFHPGGSWGWPYVGGIGYFQAYCTIGDVNCPSGKQGYAQPPRNTLDVFSPYESEQVIFTYNDSIFNKYRFVHNYNAGSGYRSGPYGWGSMTQISPDRCWMIFNSNWLGQLGTDLWSPGGGVTCGDGTGGTSRNACRHDVFAVYLCDQGTITAPSRSAMSF